MNRLNKRIAALEASCAYDTPFRPFLWPAGQSLADALAFAGLSLEDEGLLAIKLVAAGKPPCPFHECDAHLLS